MSLADADSSSARPQQQADIRLVHGGAFGVGSDKHHSEEASVHRLIASRTVVATNWLRAMRSRTRAAFLARGTAHGNMIDVCCDGCVVVAITAFARCNAIKR
jgi:lipoprotein signal peptidase